MGIFDNNGGTTTIVEEKSSWEVEKNERPATVSCFVLLENSNAFGINTKSYNIEILGNPMFTWVCRACPTIPTTIEVENNANVIETIKPYLKDSEYTIVFYSDTPLLTRGSVDEILDFVQNKGLNVCKLTRGYVFKTDYIKRVGEIFAPQTYYFDEEDFITAINFKQLSFVSDVLKSRILDYHMKNGVYFENPEQTTIGANVSIGKNTRIIGACRILGKTEIGENCKIVDSIINSAKLYDNISCECAEIEKSVIEGFTEIGSGSKIVQGTMINKNARIGKNCFIKKTSVGDDVTIGNGTFVSYARIHGVVEIGEKCNILGNEQKIVRVLGGAVLESGVQIKAGVMIGENARISEFKVVTRNVKQGESL